MQRTYVQFPEPMYQLTTIHDSFSRGYNALFWPPCAYKAKVSSEWARPGKADNRHFFFTISASCSCLAFLPWPLSKIDCDLETNGEMNPFLSVLLLGTVFITTMREQTRTSIHSFVMHARQRHSSFLHVLSGISDYFLPCFVSVSPVTWLNQPKGGRVCWASVLRKDMNGPSWHRRHTR